MNEPAWENGLQEPDIADWERFDRSPLALAAVQWRRVTESARAEAESLARSRYAEVHYERFVADPHGTLTAIETFFQLPASDRSHRFMDERFALRDMNYQWRERFSPAEISMLAELLGAKLRDFGYRVDPPETTFTGPALTQPFGSR